MNPNYVGEQIFKISSAVLDRHNHFNGIERKGQMAMNALHATRPDLYQRIMAEGGPDCYYDDSELENFWDWIATALTEEQERGFE